MAPPRPWLRVALLICLIIAGGAGCASSPPPQNLAEAPHAADVFLIDRGWHTDIGLAARQVTGPLSQLRQTFPGVRFLIFGFGERAYLLSRNRSLVDTVAALIPGPGAVLVTGLRVPPTEAFGASNVIALGVSQEGIDRVVGFLTASIALDRRGRPLRIAEGPYPGSLFYASPGTYSATYTCNTWTAEALRIGGLPISPTGVLFASQVIGRARRAADMPHPAQD